MIMEAVNAKVLQGALENSTLTAISGVTPEAGWECPSNPDPSHGCSGFDTLRKIRPRTNRWPSLSSNPLGGELMWWNFNIPSLSECSRGGIATRRQFYHRGPE
jgi:hypothetical protein